MVDQKAIWEGIRSGDRQIFEDFYAVHVGGILQFLCRMTRNRQASEEITQEVFLGLWERPNGFDPDRGSLIKYVYGIARNQAADWWRRHVGTDQVGPDSAEEATSGDTLTGILLMLSQSWNLRTALYFGLEKSKAILTRSWRTSLASPSER